MTPFLDQFEQALLSLDRLAAGNILTHSRDDWTPIQCAENLIGPVLERIGIGWEQGRVALSQVYMSGRICEELVDTILPPSDPNRKNQPKMAIATLEDYHLLGKRIVYSVIRAGGFELFDYGRMTVNDLVDGVIDDGIEILLISTLMLPSALKVKNLKTKLNQEDADIKVIVGGAPFLFDEDLWQEIGADAMGRNASEAVELISKMTGGL